MRGKIHSIAGLPVRVAIIYALLFTFAFWFYSIMWVNAPVMGLDSGSYMRAAREFSDFRLDQLQERAPGYPLLLMLTGSTQSPTRRLFFVSLLLHFGAIWLLANVLNRAGPSEIMLTLFGFLLLLPPYVESAAYVLTENLTEAILVTVFIGLVLWYLNDQTVWLIISSITIGFSALTRPTYQLLALAVLFYLSILRCLFPSATLNWRRVAYAGLILVTSSAVIVGGYAFYNYRNFGYFTVTPKFGLTLSLKTAHFVERLPDEYADIRKVLVEARDNELLTSPLHRGNIYIWSAVPSLKKLTGLEVPELSDYMLRLNILLIKQAPLSFLEDVVSAFGSFALPSSGKLANFDSRIFQLIWGVFNFGLMGGVALNLTVLLGAMFLFAVSRLRHCNFGESLNELHVLFSQGIVYGLAATIVAYTALISCVFEVGDPRYRVPTDSLIMFMLFLGCQLCCRLVNLVRLGDVSPSLSREEKLGSQVARSIHETSSSIQNDSPPPV